MTARRNLPRKSTISTAIVKYLRGLPDGWARKNPVGPYGTAGEPDLVACVNGRCLMLEVKRPGADHTLTPLQSAALARWERAGALTGVVHSVADVVALLDAHTTTPRP